MLFTVSFLFLIVSITILFIHHQTRVQTETLVKKGLLLATVLADNSIIGVFSENIDLLDDPISGICKIEGVISVDVFNSVGKRLIHKEGLPWVENNFLLQDVPQRIEKPEWGAIGNTFFFRSPVMMGEGFSNDDELLFTEGVKLWKPRNIGYVCLILDRTILKKQFRELLLKGVIIGTLFWVLGSIVAYFFSNGVTRPLHRLTEGVKTLERDGDVEFIPLETHDEIGNLANAFNKMSASLKKRQDALKKSEKSLRLLSGRLIDAQEKERKRLSIELHDELGQGLALLKHRLRSVVKELPSEAHSAEHECKSTISDIDRIIENVCRLSRDLTPSVVEDLGLSAAIRWLVDCLKEQYRIDVLLTMDTIDYFFTSEKQTNIYRIVQEILNNIGKHSAATQVSIKISVMSDHIYFSFCDNGKGFDFQTVTSLNLSERGIGLAAMDERANMLGASIEIKSRLTEGTGIEINVPINKLKADYGREI